MRAPSPRVNDLDILSLKHAIPWGQRNPVDGAVSFVNLTPEQFIARTGIKTIPVQSILPGTLTGVEIISSGPLPEIGGTVIYTKFKLESSGDATSAIFAWKFSVDGKYQAISVSSQRADEQQYWKR